MKYYPKVKSVKRERIEWTIAYILSVLIHLLIIGGSLYLIVKLGGWN